MMLKGRGAAPLMLLLACSTQRSSESQSSYAQKVDTVTEEGAWTVKTWEYAPRPGTSALAQGPRAPGKSPATQGRQSATEHTVEVAGSIPAGGPLLGSLLRYTEETHDPSKTTTGASVVASGSAEAESKSRPFGIFALLAAGWPFLLGACGAAALVILRPPWLIAGWSVLKRLLGRNQ